MLTDIKGVGEKTAKVLNKLEIYSESDLLNTLPRSYVDLSEVRDLSPDSDGFFCLADIIITEKKEPVIRGRLKVFKAAGLSGSSHVNLVWYNQNYVSKKIDVGNAYTFYGKLKLRGGVYEFNNPRFEEKGGISRFCGIQPIYTTKGLINQKTYWNIVKEALKVYCPKSVIPPDTENERGLIPLSEAFCRVHIPEEGKIEKGRDRITLEKLVRRIAAFRIARGRTRSAEKYVYTKPFDINDYDGTLPFKLTKSQLDALIKMSGIMRGEKPLNAILCGDVGSGKTIVAMLLALYTAKNGFQSAIIAPTEILARQHYANLNNLCTKCDIDIAYLCSDTPAKERKEILYKLERGEIDIIAGTHSLLNTEIKFNKLAFAAIDEQHRFGVAQRTCLIDKGKNANVLTLSATPIPRSVQLIAYGDIDYFTIGRRFENNIVTAIVKPDKRRDMWNYLYAECVENSGQVFVVAPRIADIEGIERESVEELYAELKKIFPPDRVKALHGKLSAQEKRDIIDAFSKNEISALISTTVVEVGIDVPNANFMVIMDADSFGLAALHQLRGRVGRGGGKAYCLLYTAKEPDDGLILMTRTTDGMEIAEKDFYMRGAGDIFGLNQSGEGSIEGVTAQSLMTAKAIADRLNLKELERELKSEIEAFSLTDISIT